MLGYTIPDYEMGRNQTYRVKNKVKTNNQSIEYAGFNDYNDITGITAYNNGYFPMVIFDEPSQKNDDPSKLPTKERWDGDIAAMKSSISRANTTHMMLHKREIPNIQYYFLMNPWDDHPIILDAEKRLPEKKLLDYACKNLLENHTMFQYFEDIDTLIVRATKFANPIINIFERICIENGIKSLVDYNIKKGKIDYSHPDCKKYFVNDATLLSHLKRTNGTPNYILAQRAIIKKDKEKLAEILGMKYVGESKYKKVYDLSNLKTTDTSKILDSMDAGSKQFLGWDIDQRKGGRFVLTPVYVAYKRIGYNIKKSIVVGKQVEIKSNGVGSKGQHLGNYINKMTTATEKKDLRYFRRNNKKGRSLVVADDNSKHYIRAFANNLPHLQITSTKFKNSKIWNIIKRQSWLQTAIDFGYLIIDEDNIGLLKDLSKAVSKEGNKQRDESGGFAKDYDRINSMEYPLYFVRGEIAQDYPPATLEDWGI